ncbi:hypothetical protein EV356DRAFT_506362 [Viridothelium virens]|uniref:Hydrophobic surface binding protein A n=1 Tax=Viridothelium virens TaxID=1048519 RepID=A0A6A6H2N7_VIRVR|nr:hypothetical protein EV356DRAFT_506362 [Viridothelium virens]
MKLNLSLLALLGVVTAAPTVVKRDVTTITNALASVNSATVTLDGAVKSFDGTALSALGVAGDSTAVLSAINTAITEVEGTSDVGILGALPIAGSTTQLIGTLDETINDLIKQKPLFDSSGTSAIVLSQLQQQSNASSVLGSDIKSKLPILADLLADSLNAQISAAFKRGIAAYS